MASRRRQRRQQQQRRQAVPTRAAATKSSTWKTDRGRVLLFSTSLALIFIALVFVRYSDNARDAYDSELTGDRGDIAFLIGAGHLIIDEPRLLYETSDGTMSNEQWREVKGYTFPSFYPYAPLGALAAVPLTAFEPGTAATIWRVGVAIASAVLGACVAIAFKSIPWRLAIFGCIVVWQPLLMNAQIGQTGAFVAALMAVAMLLYLRDKKLGAIALAFLAFKPTVALAPTLTVLQERPAVWLRYGIAAAILVFGPFLYLGFDRLERWLFILRNRLDTDVGGGHTYNQGLSSLVGGSAAVGVVLVIVLGVMTLLVMRAVKAKLGLHVAMAFAVFCSCLVNPHSLFYDWGIAFIGIMLLRMSNLVEEEQLSDILFGLLAVSLFIAGQYTWEQRHEAGNYLRPLTAWTLLVTGAIFVATVRQYALDVRQQRLEGVGWLKAARGL